MNEQPTIEELLEDLENHRLALQDENALRAMFIDKLWKLMGYTYEWEYLGQAERHILEDLEKLYAKAQLAESEGSDG